MKRFAGSFAALLALSQAACQPPGPKTFAGDLVLPAPRPVGEHDEAVTQGDGPNGAHIIFLNFDGVTVSPPSGFNDNSALNESAIPRSTSMIPAFDTSPYGDATTAKNTVVQWMQKFYAPFNAQIVSTRPQGVRYTMCIVGGDPSNIGVGQGAAGIAPLDCGNMNEPDICYAFSDVLTPQNTGSAAESLKAIAVTCAQETAHTYGLGHTTSMTDIMYPQLTFSANGFQMGSQQLQNDGSGQCSAPSTTQDSYQMLMDVLGPATSTMTGPSPTVAFIAPTDGSTVPLTFTIQVAASETNGTIAHVDISAEGQQLASLTAPPYQTTVMAPQDGMYTLTATAYDTAGNFQAASVTFTASSTAPPQNLGCMTAADCNAGLQCVNGQCVMPNPNPSGQCDASTPCPSGYTCDSNGMCQPDPSSMPQPGQVGATCSNNSDCGSGICATLNGKSFCTAECDPSNALSCPPSLQCVSDSGSHYCEPKNGDNGRNTGGCSATPGAPSSGGMLGALCLLAALALFRRRFV